MLSKKLFLLTMMMFMVSFLSKAQYETGTKYWQLEGAFSGNVSASKIVTPYSYHEESSSNRSSLSFKRGVFTENYLAKGWFANYNLDASTYHISSGQTKSKTYYHTVGGGYFVAKFKPLTKSLALFGEVYASGSYGFQTGSQDLSYHSFSLESGLNVGLRYFVNKKWFINGQTSLINVGAYQKRYGNSIATELQLNSVMNVNSLSISIGKTF
ncbi:hypothetical protein [Arcicella rigui]|uniref:Outer membrane protein beta-barrel domain-containing protein n=1 Tax=Arcicella rigui TaxID=797020 RepID=A0ABU5QEL6_9BACT|nr:hypothetical protein [Arcicella rigui]MEA5141305.1 hypothetical protein [Arcicella rigui]